MESVRISAEGEGIVPESEDRTVCIWDMEERGWDSTELRGHQGLVSNVAISVDGGRIVSGSGARTVRVWEMDDVAWNNTCCKEFAVPVRNVSIVCQKEVIRVVLLTGRILYCDWELREKREKRWAEWMAHETTVEMADTIPSETKLLQMVEGHRIY